MTYLNEVGKNVMRRCFFLFVVFEDGFFGYQISHSFVNPYILFQEYKKCALIDKESTFPVDYMIPNKTPCIGNTIELGFSLNQQNMGKINFISG